MKLCPRNIILHDKKLLLVWKNAVIKVPGVCSVQKKFYCIILHSVSQINYIQKCSRYIPTNYHTYEKMETLQDDTTL